MDTNDSASAAPDSSLGDTIWGALALWPAWAAATTVDDIAAAARHHTQAAVDWPSFLAQGLLLLGVSVAVWQATKSGSWAPVGIALVVVFGGMFLIAGVLGDRALTFSPAQGLVGVALALLVSLAAAWRAGAGERRRGARTIWRYVIVIVVVGVAISALAGWYR